MSRFVKRVIRPWPRGELFSLLKLIFTTDHQFQSNGILSRIDRNFKLLICQLRRPFSIMIMATLIATVCGLLINHRAWLIACFLALMTFLGRVIPGRFLKIAEVKMFTLVDRVTEGETVSLLLIPSTSSVWPLAGITVETGLIHFSSNSSLDSDILKIHLPLVWRNRQKLSVDWIPEQFGIYPFSRPVLKCSFPFQLNLVSRSFAPEFRIIVLPKVFHIPEFPEFPSGIDDVGTVLGNRKGFSGETLSLRAYRHGDDPRRIHWPQTARTGCLVVREQQAAIKPRLTVHLGHPNDYRFWTLHWAGRLASSLILTGLNQGWQCELIFDGSGGFNRVVRNCRSERFLEVIAAFGNDPGFIIQYSEPYSSGIQADHLHLRIVTKFSDHFDSSTDQKFILLGDSSP
ncbi:MAG: hypothetical protein RJA81_1739, partial [Planctomycetota bacterium]